MIRRELLRAVCLVVAALLSIASADAQRVRNAAELAKQKVLRETVVDDNGLTQWKKFEPKRCTTCLGKKIIECEFCKDSKVVDRPCPECKDEKEAACHECAGVGKSYDPIVMMPCPGCFGSGVLGCGSCGTRGGFKVKGSGEGEQKCETCKAARGFPCTVCKGKRLVPVVRPKKVLATDALVHLKKARAAIEKSKEEMRGYIGDDKTKKAVAEYKKAVKPAQKYLLCLKPMGVLYQTVLKRMDKARHWIGAAQKSADERDRFKKKTEFILEHTMKLLDAAIARAEANEAIEAALKDKK